MPSRIPESSRSEVVQTWLQPQSRNKVAAICGISQAAVSGIIDEWKKSVGVSRAEQLRDLATTIDRSGISAAQCAQGYRIARQLSNLGVDEDEVAWIGGRSLSEQSPFMKLILIMPDLETNFAIARYDDCLYRPSRSSTGFYAGKNL